MAYMDDFNPFQYLARTPTTWAATLPAGTGTIAQRQALRSNPQARSPEWGTPAVGWGQRLAYRPMGGNRGAYEWSIPRSAPTGPVGPSWAPESMPGPRGPSYAQPSALEMLANRKRGFMPETGWYGGGR